MKPVVWALALQVLWTPTFKGSREQRFLRALEYYQEKMGLNTQEHTRYYVVEITTGKIIIDGDQKCATAVAFWRDQMSATRIKLSLDPACNAWKPELLALHEQCHRRLMHLWDRTSNKTREEREFEVSDCMLAYSSEERR